MKVLRCALLLAALASAFVCHPSARACDCAQPEPARALAAAGLVFEGRVLSVRPSEYANQPCGGLCPDTSVRLRVTRSWKGRPGRVVTVLTDLSTDCGYPFHVGTSYLVYASAIEPNGPYLTDTCTRTRRIDHAREDLRVLGRGTRVR